MFRRKKKLYKIVYKLLTTHIAVVIAKDEFQAIKKVYKLIDKYSDYVPSIISIEEIEVMRKEDGKND